ncbi:MAG: Gfo/Idh/MocA family oxidoreductase, partial [Victivallales bacterium]|nr:Gfo/Idh/MocA family oxidoreductase [Victivallales bacterium]
MEINRRDFLRGMGAAGAGMMVFNQTSGLFAQNANPAATPANSNINVALIGSGTQGRILAECIRKIPGVNFKAICDIWEYNRNYTAKRIKAYTKKNVNAYVDYKEMLDTEKDLDAVVIATPDCYHAEHTIACLKAGKHVYCEKEMSHKLELAAEMVKVSNETGKLLQIGHQRRSNPVYQYAYKMIHEDKMCGRLTALYGQWNRTPEDLLAWPQGKEVPEDILKKYGYENMEQFKNWRWFKKYSGGPIADLGSHQIDIFSWFLNAEPYAVTAFGGADYFPTREWYEDVTVMYDYKTTFDGKPGSARSYYQVLNTSGWQEYYERFSGDRG